MVTWDAAREYCESIGGQLAAFETSYEWGGMTSWIRNRMCSYTILYFHRILTNAL